MIAEEGTGPGGFSVCRTSGRGAGGERSPHLGHEDAWESQVLGGEAQDDPANAATSAFWR